MKHQYNVYSAEKIANLAIRMLEECESKSNLDDTLDRIRNSEFIKTVSDILFNYFRNKAKIDYIIAKFAEKRGKRTPPKFKRVLDVAVTQMLYQTGIKVEIASDVAVTIVKKKYGVRAGGFINAVLRQVSASDVSEHLKGAPENILLNIPEKIYNRWQKEIPEFLSTFTKFADKRAPVTFRLTGEVSEEELSEAECFKVTLPEWADGYDFYRVKDAGVLFKKNWLQDGKIYIQDPSTLSPCSMYTPHSGDIALDLCSAPGGKTLLLAEKMGECGIVISSDLSFFRQLRSQENITAHKLDNCLIIAASALSPPFLANCADMVLLDVPCSNTGVFRKRPDVLWNFSERKLRELVQLQKKMLEKSLHLLKEGGTLIYSTCSIEPVENSEQVKLFLKRHPELKLLEERQLFPSAFHDGGYSARISIPSS
jgi:16S rRNA (cytosine967-C5)-methyltransferase